MKILRCRDYEEMSRVAAQSIVEGIKDKADLVLGLATGKTPLGLYRLLVEAYQRGEVDFSRVTTFNLDEYYPLAPTHPRSFRSFMDKHLFSQVNIRRERTHLPNGAALDPAREAERYERAIFAAGGIDLQVLGIGRNGHIGFNEPGTALGSLTQKIQLHPESVAASRADFDSETEVPRYAISMGIRTIMLSRRILLLASGADKAAILARALQGPVGSQVPASVLQLHPDLTVVVDEPAGRVLFSEAQSVWDEVVAAKDL
ncbi:MAG: glucosamine-6-phosphate deaminase [Firmicutes bacterium]|nr:glucosamine-6-phosphate deaminase [Bacillota bacterium]MCL5040131.1 glucosamine-6-phosphate deaminase [Bacillota bacterium]